MNGFPIVAALTLCASFAILWASFDDLREAPLNLDAATTIEAMRKPIPVVANRGKNNPAPGSILEANEGLLDHELASADPIQAWLDRTLTPPADYFPPSE